MLGLIKWLIRAAIVVAAFAFWKEDLIFMMIICIVIFITVLLTDLWMQFIFGHAMKEINETEKDDKLMNEYPIMKTNLAMEYVPNWLTAINFFASLASSIMLVVSLIIYFI